MLKLNVILIIVLFSFQACTECKSGDKFDIKKAYQKKDQSWLIAEYPIYDIESYTNLENEIFIVSDTHSINKIKWERCHNRGNAAYFDTSLYDCLIFQFERNNVHFWINPTKKLLEITDGGTIFNCQDGKIVGGERDKKAEMRLIPKYIKRENYAVSFK